MSDKSFLNRILLACGRGPVRLWRNNVAKAWVPSGQPIIARTACTAQLQPGDVVLRKARILHAGLSVGSGDLLGYKTITITPEMVGTRVAQFVSLEGKQDGDRMSPAQTNWLVETAAAGGIAAEIRSVEQAEQLLGFR